jgi:hypothetical protein
MVKTIGEVRVRPSLKSAIWPPLAAAMRNDLTGVARLFINL